jgi:hypothetical protein
MKNLLDKDSYIEILKKENKELQEKNQELQERLVKYTNPERVKKYHERNKEVISEKKKEWYNKKKLDTKVCLKIENDFIPYINTNDDNKEMWT